MSTMFESAVRDRRAHTPWARMSAAGFMADMIWHEVEPTNSKAAEAFETRDGSKYLAVVLSVRYRPDVVTRRWWILEWTGADGEQHFADGQELDLVLWRAAELELAVSRRTDERAGDRQT